MTVSIQEDMIVEDQFERFFINLRRYESAVILSQPTASVSIQDNDSESSNCMHTKSYTCIRMSIFATSYLPQWSQLDSVESIQCLKMLVALGSLYLF